ncbi:hypothetical protein C8R46DRAFT_379382 [Mycena filopes]|nr:hypothetical protein C8R46DRAFT_379382 [Mycena filopes]
MMLVQKQPHFSMQLAQPAFIHQHRRHPSAPPPQVLAVQPTRTPGLLSLSRPPRPPKDHHKGSPKPRPAQPAPSRSPKPAPAEPTPTDSTNVRGRLNNNSAQAKRNTGRSSSHAAPSRRRQPSPDPFRSSAPAPAPAPPPNKRRGNNTNAIPVPAPRLHIPQQPATVSRSDPVLSHMPQQRTRPNKPVPVRSATLDEWPVCDDMTEAGSRPSTPVSPIQDRRQAAGSPSRPRPALHLSEPRTPTRRTPRAGFALPEPPRTAPLSSVTPGAFPFPTNGNSNNGGSPHSSPKRRPAAAAKRAKHLSEGFAFPIPAFNPYAAQSGEGYQHQQRRSRSSERSDAQAQAHAQAQATLFASSMFQNSPSPEELPPPTFA